MWFNSKYYLFSFILLLGLFIPNYSSCDVGSCARYKINIIFDNNDSLLCFIQFDGYETNLKYLSEDEILRHLKENFRSDSIPVYKRIQTLNYPEGNKYYGFKYSAAANEDRVVIDIRRILRIRKLDVSRCEFGNFPEDDQYGIHFTSQIIEGLSQKEIDLLQIKPYSQVQTGPPNAPELDICLNYNKDVSEKQLKKLCALYLKNERNLPFREFEKLQQKHYLETVKKLRKMNIIVIHLYGYD